MNIRKLILWIITVVIMIIIAKKAWDYFDSTNPAIHPPTPAESPLPPRQNTNLSGWKFDHKGTDTAAYDWFIPTTPATSGTEWFTMRGAVITYNTTYRVKTDTIIEFQDKDDSSKVYAVWTDGTSGESYLRLEDGTFSKNVIDSKEFLAYRLKASKIRFLPIKAGATIDVKMGRKE